MKPKGRSRVWQIDLCMGEHDRTTAINSLFFIKSVPQPGDVFVSSSSAYLSFIPAPLLSANTFTFLVLLSNKRGGMRGDLLTLLKQTSWTPSAEEPPPPSLPPAVNSANHARRLLHSARQQCCGFVPGYILFTSSLHRRPPDPGVSTIGSHPVWCPLWCRYQLIGKGIV